MTNESIAPIVEGAKRFELPGNRIGIVILHGYGGSIGDYRGYAELMNQRGYSVFGLRLAGHGQGQHVLRQTSIEDMRQGIRVEITTAADKCDQIFIIGSSFGAVVALDMAIQSWPKVVGVLVVNPALSYRGVGWLQRLVLRVMNVFIADYPKKGLTQVDRAQAEKVGSAPAWPIKGILATTKFAANIIKPHIRDIKIPVAVLTSRQDRVVNNQESDLLAAELGNQVLIKEVIPFDTHRPFRDQAATAYLADKSHEFIKKVLA